VGGQGGGGGSKGREKKSGTLSPWRTSSWSDTQNNGCGRKGKGGKKGRKKKKGGGKKKKDNTSFLMSDFVISSS